MRFRPLFFALLIIGAIELAKAGKDTNELEFSREDDETSDDYYDRHSDYSEEDHENKKTKIEVQTVCQAKHADRCECEKSGRLDCRKETRDRKANGITIEPFKTASINVEDKSFKPKYVYLSGNQIEIITKATLLPDIQSEVIGLDLSFNDIEFIGPNAFDSLKKLKKLRLNQNFIMINESLDGWITEELGGHLELLNLAYNSINKIPDAVFKPLHSLKKLILDGNSGIVLGDNTFDNENLEALSLDKCGLDKLPESLFSKLPNLKFLSLIGNNFGTFPSVLKKIPKLSILDLSENKQLKHWEKETFKDYPKIERFYLRDMKFDSYDDCAFCGLTKLNYLDLSGSKELTTLGTNAFGYVNNKDEATKALKTLKLEDCKLSNLNELTLDWTQLDHLWLGGNPWNCDQNLEWLITNKQIHLYGTKEANCSKPSNMVGHNLMELQKQDTSKQTTSSGFTHFLYTLFYVGVSIGFIGILLTAVMFVTKRFDTRNVITSLFSRQQPTGAGGFSNLNSSVGHDNERVFEDDDDNEFQPRPAAV